MWGFIDFNVLAALVSWFLLWVATWPTKPSEHDQDGVDLNYEKDKICP